MTAPNDRIRQLSGQLILRARVFLGWWRDSLLAWLPLRWIWALGWAPARLLVRREGDQLVVLREIAETSSEVARMAWPTSAASFDAALDARQRRLPRHWLLPVTQVLRRPLRLPAAAMTRLHDVVGFEVDRQTPFSADQVVHDVRVLAPVGETQLDVELVVLPRTQLERWQQDVGELASGFSGIDVADDATALQVNLLPPAQRHRQSNPQRRRDLFLLAVSAVLLLLAGERVLDNREAAADALRARVQDSAQQARGVAAQRGQLQTLVDGARFLDEQRARQPSTLQVWNELSRLLPAGTYLEKMGIENGSLQLIGLSREANQLVALLEPSPLWRRVNLTGVLQADQAEQGRDRFTLSAELQPVVNPAASTTSTAPAQEATDAVRSERP